MAKLFLILTLLVGAGLLVWKLACKDCHPPKPPTLDPEEWWGPEQMKGRTDKSIRPFKVKFDEEMIKDLRSRLTSHRALTPPLEGTALEYGMNTDQLQPILDYWAKNYQFAEREKFFNQLPQFKTNIQGLDIHFIRVKPEVKAGVEVVPILLLHGWPGSVREFYEAVPLLTAPRPGYDFVFEVIVPSLPGYGFSDGAVRPGLATPQMAMIMRNLMNRLGHKRYYIQGGDWGAIIVSAMATLFPDDVLGHHTNMAFVTGKCAMVHTVLGSFMPSLVVEETLADRMYPLSSFFAYFLQEFGYMHLQATKPDTVGVGLNDSPSGLAAYILEKFVTWTDRKARSLPAVWSKDALIDNLMVYWSTNSITTSMRLYAEEQSNKNRALQMADISTPVPTWAIQAKHELFYQPPGILKKKFPNLVNTTVLDFGGHFFAFEQPKMYSEDVFKAVKAFKKWHEERRREKTEL